MGIKGDRVSYIILYSYMSSPVYSLCVETLTSTYVPKLCVIGGDWHAWDPRRRWS